MKSFSKLMTSILIIVASTKKLVGITVQALVVLGLTLNTVNAHETRVIASGSLLAIGNDSCTVIDYKTFIDFANKYPETLSQTAKDFNWGTKSVEGQALCDKLKPSKVLQVAPNGKYLTRPTYDITATTKTGNTVKVGSPCEGEIIKYRYSTKSYYKIPNRNETVLCGEY